MGDRRHNLRHSESLVKKRWPSPFTKMASPEGIEALEEKASGTNGNRTRGLSQGYVTPAAMADEGQRAPPLEFSTLVTEQPESVLRTLQEGALIKLGGMTISDQEAVTAFGKSTMLTRGRNVSSDLNFENFWRSEIKKLIKGKNEIHLGWSKDVHLTAYVLYVNGATTAGFDGLLHKILMNFKAGSCDLQIFELPAVRAIIDYKWESWIGNLLFFELILHASWMLSYSLFLMFFLSVGAEDVNSMDSQWRSKPAFVFILLAFILMWPFLIIEGFTVAAYKLRWFSAWNVIDISCYSLQTIIFIIYAANLEDILDSTWFSISLGLESVLLFTRLGYYGRSFGSVDVSIVDTVQVVLNEVKWFLLFIFLTVFSYGLAFGAMFRTAVDEAVEEEESIGAMNFSSVPKALLTTFGFMMGQFQLSYFFQVGPEVGIPAAILFMIYQVLINVTLLNLLVAIMIEAYSKSKKKEAATTDLNRAQAIDEVEMTLPIHYLGRKFKEYIHILVVKDDRGDFFPDSVSLPSALFHQESIPTFSPDTWLAPAGIPMPGRKSCTFQRQDPSYARSRSMPQGIETSALSAVMEADGTESEMTFEESAGNGPPRLEGRSQNLPLV